MNKKRFAVDVVGYLSLIPVFLLYNALERSSGGYIAVLAAIAAFLPVAAVWRIYHNRFSR